MRRVESVEAVGGAGDFRRTELETILQDGAWNEAFEEWAEYTDLNEEEFQVIRDLGLIQQLDIFWDPSEERLRFEAPVVPEDWRDRLDVTPPDTEDLAPRLEGEPMDLGHTVVEMLDDGYVDYGERNLRTSFGAKRRSVREPENNTSPSFHLGIFLRLSHLVGTIDSYYVSVRRFPLREPRCIVGRTWQTGSSGSTKP